jgi:hypothetical protein
MQSRYFIAGFIDVEEDVDIMVFERMEVLGRIFHDSFYHFRSVNSSVKFEDVDQQY